MTATKPMFVWRRLCLCWFATLLPTANVWSDELSSTGPFSPEQSISRFVLPPDCRIELAAAEPDVVDPVHIAFDSAGQMWVVEYSDYPNGPADGQPGRSRIRVLRDDDGDGRYTAPTLFADQLLFATGVLPWRDGVIVTSSGSVRFMRDTDGDGRADDVQEWFVGFKQENPQLRANHPTLGLDNSVYIASGLRGGEVGPGKDWAAAFGRSTDTPPSAVALSGRDFRFDPLTGDFEAVSGPGQFGLTFNNWGDRFVCDNRHPCRQVVFEDRDLRRNPRFTPSEILTDVLPSGDASHLYPISRTWTTSNLHANQFTAACGLSLYRGNALPESMGGAVFVCDPTANLVHAALTHPAGAVYTSTPLRPEVEFLATRDEWFRPVNTTMGPDGALYVVDMYRAVIEHPQFMPEELKTRPDLLLGTDRGRVYRIVARDHQGPTAAVAAQSLPDNSDWAGWVQQLSHPNSWQRDAAQSMLLHSQPESAVALLRAALASSPSTAGRVLALRLLDRQAALTSADWETAMRDTDPEVQRQAVLIASRFADDGAQIAQRVGELAASTDDDRVRMACALRLPDLPAPRTAEYLRELLVRPEIDPWTAEAVASAPPQMVIAVLTLPAKDDGSALRGPAAAALLDVAGATASPEQLGEILSHYSTANDLARMATGLRKRGSNWSGQLAKLPADQGDIVRDWFRRTRETAADVEQPLDTRLAAIALLTQQPWKEITNVVTQLAGPVTHPSLRAAAFDVIAQFRTEDVGNLLVDNFTSFPPQVRSAAIRALVSSTARLTQLLDEVEAEHIPPLLIDPATIKRMTTTGDPAVRKRAQQLFASLTPVARKQVLSDYQTCLSLESAPDRGQAVFKANCSTCHKIGEIGVNVAPDISDSRTKTREYLLASILDPNQAIDNNYFSYTVVDHDGLVHTGILATETSTSITLKQPEGKEITIPRDQIADLKSNGVSLMPEGLERTITPQQMADLISFIKNWRYLDGSVPKEVIR
ncbi:MAG: PVC-type heme-binding CxxCH protein [Planctomycetaceae bacterium]